MFVYVFYVSSSVLSHCSVKHDDDLLFVFKTGAIELSDSVLCLVLVLGDDELQSQSAVDAHIFPY